MINAEKYKAELMDVFRGRHAAPRDIICEVGCMRVDCASCSRQQTCWNDIAHWMLEEADDE